MSLTRQWLQIRQSAVWMTLMLLSGCASDQISDPTYRPVTANYQAPDNATAQTAATVVGSSNFSSNPFSTSTVVYLNEVDGKPVNIGCHNWAQPILLSPGDHSIEFIETGCGMFNKGWPGSADVDIVVNAGETYTLRATPPVLVHFGVEGATGWVEDSKGHLISRIYDDSGKLIRKKEYFTLNPDSGGPDTIPIFLR